VVHAALQRIDRDMLHIHNKQFDVTRGENPVQRALGSLARRYITVPLISHSLPVICRYDNNDTARSHVPRGWIANLMMMTAIDMMIKTNTS
jgi:hypothetical protein